MRWRIVAVLMVVIAATAGWWYWPGEERRVRARLEALAAQLSIPAGEAGMPRMARAAGVRAFFTDDVAVELPAGDGPSLRGRDQIGGLVARMTVPPGGTTVELLDVDIQFLPEKTSADVRLNTRVVTREAGDKPAILDARMIALTLRKSEGVWLVSNARIMPTDDSLAIR